MTPTTEGRNPPRRSMKRARTVCCRVARVGCREGFRHGAGGATALLLTVCALGCGARSRVQRPVVTAVASAAPIARDAFAEVRFVASLESRLRYASESSETMLAVAGGVRVERDSAGVRLARQTVIGAFQSVIDLGGSWVFFTLDGLVARADSFLGDLTPLGTACRRGPLARATRGRLAIPCGERVFLTDGRSLTAAGATPSPIRDAAFSDALHGAASLRDGSLVVTFDGGATWRPVALGDDLCVRVAFEGGALVVTTLARTATLDANGRLAPITERPDQEEPERDYEPASRARDLPEDVLRAVSDAVGHELAASGVTLADGSSLQVDGSMVVHRGSDGRELSRSEIGASPRLRSWGSAALVFSEFAYQTRDGETFTMVAPPAGADQWTLTRQSSVFSDDGVHAAVPFGCESPRDDDDTSLCVLLDGASRWQQLAREGSAGSPQYPYAMHDGSLLIGGCTRDDCETRLLDVESGRAWSPTFAGDASDLRLTALLRWTSDGALVGVACRGRTCDGERRWLVRGDPWSPLAVSPLPDGTVRVRFANRSRGVAIGRTLRSLWRTLDGGRSWEAVNVPVEGQALEWPGEGESRCDERGCVISGLVALDGWGPLRAPSRTAFNAITATDDSTQRPTDNTPAPLASTELRCTDDGPATDSPWRAQRTSDDESVDTRAWYGGALMIRRRDRSVTLDWRGEQISRGSITFAEGDVETLGYSPPIGASARAPMLFVDGALLPLWAGPRAPRIDLRSAMPNGRLSTGGEELAVLPLSSGGVLASMAMFARGRTFALVFEVGENGALRARRAFGEGAALLASGVGVVRGQSARVTLDDRGVVRASPIASGAAETIATLTGPLRVCTDAEARSAAQARLAVRYSSTPLLHFDDPSSDSTPKQLDVALTASGLCVAGVATSTQPPMRWLRASGGALRGFTEDLTHRRALRCEVAR